MTVSTPPAGDLLIRLRPGAGQFVRHIIDGQVREVCAFGARGDRKTSSAFVAMILFAERHAAAGYPLPVPVICVTDTFTSHKLKTHRTLEHPWWMGTWRLSDGGHVATAIVGGREAVRMDLFGVEDEGAKDRVRMETCLVHFDEVAEVSFLTSRGMDETAWGIALTSQRIPSYAHPAFITTNYPEEEHWAWKRFVTKDRPGDRDLNTAYVRITPGESASATDRAEWARSLAARPDLLKRLHAGEPGSVLLGDPVTPAYQESRHYRREPVRAADGPLYLGWDFWFHPACVLASVSSLGQLRVHLAQRLDGTDAGTLAKNIVRPWLTRHDLHHRPLVHTGDPTGETADQGRIEHSAQKAILEVLPGAWKKVSNSPEQRITAINGRLLDSVSTGEPAILLAGPDVTELNKALSGGWHLDAHGRPVKDGDRGKHSHVGDAAAYMALSLFGVTLQAQDLGRWANQSAYTQPWDGAGPNEHSPSPASAALGRLRTGPGTTAYRDRWTKQYQEE